MLRERQQPAGQQNALSYLGSAAEPLLLVRIRGHLHGIAPMRDLTKPAIFRHARIVRDEINNPASQ
jgi:hypothetical protein